MNLDETFPHLSDVAREHGLFRLESRKERRPGPGYLRLQDCCYLVERGRNDETVAGPLGYLKTLDELLGFLIKQPLTRKKIWQKLMGGPPSGFLDTVAEAAWALHFRDRNIPFELEVPFDRTDPKSKDADLVVTLDDQTYWLDVLNAALSPPATLVDIADRKSLETELARRAIRKYKEKFRTAVKTGPLKGVSVGVLLCILKSEEAMVPFSAGETPPPPADLFAASRRPGLAIVWVHTLRPMDASAVLRPEAIIRWNSDAT